MAKKPKVFQDPSNPEKVIVISPPYTSYYLRTRGADGNPCEPWATEEATVVEARSMEYRDWRVFYNYKHRALLLAIEEAKKLTLGKLL